MSSRLEMSPLLSPATIAWTTSSSRVVNPYLSRRPGSNLPHGLGEIVSHTSTDHILVVHDTLDAINQETRRRLLENNAAGPQLYGSHEFIRVDSRRQKHDANRRGVDRGQRFKATHSRHRHVEQQHVRFDVEGELQRLHAVSSLADHLKAWLALEQPPEPIPQDLVIVGNCDPDTASWFRHARPPQTSVRSGLPPQGRNAPTSPRPQGAPVP